MGQTLDCFDKGIEFTQSHRPEEAIPDSYDKCEPALVLKYTITYYLLLRIKLITHVDHSAK